MEEETASEDPQFYVDIEGAGDSRRSMSVMIEGRKCYEHRSAAASHVALESDAQESISQIADHCSQTADYLLDDTPLKEAIFRVLLAGGNEPVTAQQVSDALTSRWALSAYPRDASPRVVGRLLEHSENYSIVAVPEPEPEPEPLVADIVGPPDDAEVNGGDDGGQEAADAAAQAGEGAAEDAERPPPSE